MTRSPWWWPWSAGGGEPEPADLVEQRLVAVAEALEAATQDLRSEVYGLKRSRLNSGREGNRA